MQWQRKTGAGLMVAGMLLLGCWAVPTVYGRASARLAVAAFRGQGGANRLWDGARILAYERSLGIKMVPEAVLRVPKVGLDVPVYEGTGELAMNRGVGHIEGTAEPGQAGNVGISGHRDGFFRGLKDLVPGDRIEVQRATGRGATEATDVYEVKTIRVVFPSETNVLKSTDQATLTLVTCYPFYYVGPAPQRYIVQATLVSGKAGTS